MKWPTLTVHWGICKLTAANKYVSGLMKATPGVYFMIFLHPIVQRLKHQTSTHKHTTHAQNHSICELSCASYIFRYLACIHQPDQTRRANLLVCSFPANSQHPDHHLKLHQVHPSKQDRKHTVDEQIEQSLLREKIQILFYKAWILPSSLVFPDPTSCL